MDHYDDCRLLLDDGRRLLRIHGICGFKYISEDLTGVRDQRYQSVDFYPSLLLFSSGEEGGGRAHGSVSEVPIVAFVAAFAKVSHLPLAQATGDFSFPIFIV